VASEGVKPLASVVARRSAVSGGVRRENSDVVDF
jgi:hypothetical protein